MAEATENSVRIEAPFELVWDVTNDVANWCDIFSEYADVEILKSGDDRILFRLTTVPDENGKSWSWVSERQPDRASRSVAARRVEPGPFKYMDINWSYTVIGSETELIWRQNFEMRPDAPVSDAQMKARIDRNSKVQMTLIKNHIERLNRKVVR